MGFPFTEGYDEDLGPDASYKDWLFPANPAAGQNLAYVVESRNWVRPFVVIATIATDANVANRWVSIGCAYETWFWKPSRIWCSA